MASPVYRGPMPTLTEDDVREQGERETMPPPVPAMLPVIKQSVSVRVPLLRMPPPTEAAWPGSADGAPASTVNPEMLTETPAATSNTRTS